MLWLLEEFLFIKVLAVFLFWIPWKEGVFTYDHLNIDVYTYVNVFVRSVPLYWIHHDLCIYLIIYIFI
jgi:hypothetical protein